jgi:hypothetical protein
MLSLRIEEFDDAVMRLLGGKALQCGNRADNGRAKLEAEHDGLTENITRLLASLAEAGAAKWPELAAKLKTRTAERDALNRHRLARVAAGTGKAEGGARKTLH